MPGERHPPEEGQGQSNRAGRPLLRFLRAPWLRGLAVVLLLALPLLWRLVDLEADPPVNVEFEHAFATDEGYYTCHARAVVLFDQPPLAPFWDNRRVSPLFDMLVEASFSLLGVHTWALRLPQVLLGMATVGLLYSMLRQEAGTVAARWGALFLAWSHLFFVYNRVGMYQTLQTFLSAACAWAWLRGWRRPPYFFLCGVLAALILLTSLLGMLFLAGLVTATLIATLPPGARSPRGGQRDAGPDSASGGGSLRRGGRRAGLVLALAGFTVALGPLFFLFLWPERGLVLRDLARSGALPVYSNPHQVAGNLLLLLYNPFFLLNLLPLSGMLVYSGQVLWRWRRGRRPGALTALLLSWFWVTVLPLAVVNYRPTRYFLHLLVPLSAALALVVMRWEDYLALPRRLSFWAAGPLTVVLVLAGRDLLGPGNFRGDRLWWAGVAATWVGALLGSVLFGLRSPGKVAARVGAALAAGCLLANLAFGLSAWQRRRHTVIQVSRELGQILPAGALLLHGCTLTFENRLHCLTMIEPEDVDPAALPGFRLFYFTEAPAEGLPGDRLWGEWQVLDKAARLYEVAPGRPNLQGLWMGHF